MGGKCSGKPLTKLSNFDLPSGDINLEIKCAERIKNNITSQMSNFLLTALSEHYLFRGLSQSDLEQFFPKLIFIVVPIRENIVTQGEKGSFFFILNSGSASVIVDGNEVNRLSAGTCFGEFALLTDSTRKATIRTIEKCTLWALDRKTFNNAMKLSISGSKEETSKFIYTSPFFASLPESQKSQIAEIAILTEYSNRKTVLAKGQKTWFIYMIKSGSVKFIADGADLYTLSAGQIFGESTLIGQSHVKREGTAIAIGPTQIITLDSNTILQVLGAGFQTIFMRNVIISALCADESFVSIESSLIKRIADLFEIKLLSQGDVAISSKADARTKAYVVCIGQISAGDSEFKSYELIGLMNSNSSRMINTTYTCSCDSIIAQANESDIESVLGFTIKALRTDIGTLNFLKSVSLLSSLDKTKLDILFRSYRVVEFPKERYIYMQSETDTKIYVIKSGSVGLYSFATILVSKLDKGCIFGETCIVAPSRMISAKTLTRVTLFEFSKETFLRVLSSNSTKIIKRSAYHEMQFQLSQLKISNEPLLSYATRHYFLGQTADHPYYVEVIHKEYIHTQEDFMRIVDYKCIMFELNLPHIPRLLRTFGDDQCVFFVYEFFPFEYLDKSKAGNLNESEIRFILLSLGSILENIHSKGILHRNINPFNVLIDEEGIVWLTGMNYAKKVDRRSFTLLDTTPEYKAKETLMGRGYTKSSDYWSLGIILYELLYKKLPFGISANDPPDIVTEKVVKGKIDADNSITNTARDVVLGLLNEDPLKRFHFEEVKNSEWCAHINVSKIRENVIDPEYKPSIKPKRKEFRDIDRYERTLRKVAKAEDGRSLNWDEYF